MNFNKRGYPVKYGYNADAHSKFGLDYSATKKEFRQIPLTDVEPEHFVLRNVSKDAINMAYKNYLGMPVCRIEMQSVDGNEKYMHLVDELECDISENEDGTYDIDLGPDEGNVFQVYHGDDKGDYSFVNAGVIVAEYEATLDKQNNKNLPNREIIELDEPSDDGLENEME